MILDAIIGAMHDGVGATEVLSIVVAIFVHKVDDVYALDLVAISVLGARVEQGEVVTFAQGGQQDAGDGSAGAGKDDFSFGHGAFPVSTILGEL